MKRPLVILLHIGYWGLYLIAIAILLAFYYKDDPQLDARFADLFPIIMTFAFFPCFFTFYFFYFLIFPKFLRERKYILAFTYGVLYSYGIAVLTYIIIATTFGEDCLGQSSDEDDFVGITIFIAFEAFVSGIIALIIRGFLTWFQEIKLKETLKQKNQEMELALVKAQLDPHFLFNTINNIDVLILKNADQASDYLNKLSDIMRFMLYETKSDKILLAKEIEYIEKYIELQKIRTSNAHYVNFSVSGKLNGQTIAPMIFIPFIENAFKHTTNKKIKNAISIKIDIQKESIQFKCINKCDLNRKTQDLNPGGLGNDLIQKRLNLIYPDQHKLDIFKNEISYNITLSINNEKL